MHEGCKECKWNKYPECLCKIERDGSYFRIDNLVESYCCIGFRDGDKVYDDSIKIKSDLEVRIDALEEKTKDLSVEKL